ncbi:MAG: HAD family phosphatase [Parachlamydiales bacterium]|nr:HAD family phosphatase [Parachlamydiales bacterium]
MKTPSFLFDNDGVLMDSGDLHWEAWKELEKEVPSFSMTHDQFIHSFGKTNDLILSELIPSLSKDERTKLGILKETLFRKVSKGKIQLLPGMEDFLSRLKEKNIPRIIASSAPIDNILFFLEETPLKHYFSQYVSGEEVAHGKPAPDVFLEAAKRLNKDPKECIVLEDSLAGLEAGKKAGCFVIALATSLPAEKLKHYDLIYPSPAYLDYPTILTQWNKVHT